MSSAPSLPDFLAVKVKRIVVKHEDLGRWLEADGKTSWVDKIVLDDGSSHIVRCENDLLVFAEDVCGARWENFKKKTAHLNLDLEALLRLKRG